MPNWNEVRDAVAEDFDDGGRLDEPAPDNDWHDATVVRDRDGIIWRRQVGPTREPVWGSFDSESHPANLDAPVTVIIDAEGRNVEADNTMAQMQALLDEQAEAKVLAEERAEKAHAIYAEDWRTENNALRDKLRAAEKRAEKAEGQRDAYRADGDHWYERATEESKNVREISEHAIRADRAWKSARKRASEWRERAEEMERQRDSAERERDAWKLKYGTLSGQIRGLAWSLPPEDLTSDESVALLRARLTGESDQ